MSVPPPINVVASDPEERSLAALAHGSILLNCFVPGLGIIAAFAVWLTQRERSAYAAYQALQATVYQLIWALFPVAMTILGVMAVVGGAVFSAATDSGAGLLALPLVVLGILAVIAVALLGLLYALVAAYEAYQGRDFRYWLVGSLVKHP